MIDIQPLKHVTLRYPIEKELEKGLQPKLNFVLCCFVLICFLIKMRTIVIELYFQIRRLHINLALQKKKKKKS